MYFCNKCKKVVKKGNMCTCGTPLSKKEEVIACPNCEKLFYMPKRDFECTKCGCKVVLDDVKEQEKKSKNNLLATKNKSKKSNYKQINNVENNISDNFIKIEEIPKTTIEETNEENFSNSVPYVEVKDDAQIKNEDFEEVNANDIYQEISKFCDETVNEEIQDFNFNGELGDEEVEQHFENEEELTDEELTNVDNLSGEDNSCEIIEERQVDNNENTEGDNSYHVTMGEDNQEVKEITASDLLQFANEELEEVKLEQENNTKRKKKHIGSRILLFVLIVLVIALIANFALNRESEYEKAWTNYIRIQNDTQNMILYETNSFELGQTISDDIAFARVSISVCTKQVDVFDGKKWEYYDEEKIDDVIVIKKINGKWTIDINDDRTGENIKSVFIKKGRYIFLFLC